MHRSLQKQARKGTKTISNLYYKLGKKIYENVVATFHNTRIGFLASEEEQFSGLGRPSNWTKTCN